MLRTNESFLSYIESLYDQQKGKGSIKFRSYSKGEKLFNQNENSSKIMLIKEGITKCYFTEDNDKDFIMEFLGKGEVLGEIELIKKNPCLCTVEAMTHVSVYVISVSYFTSLLKHDLKLNNLLIDVFAGRIINTSSRASYQQLYTIEYSLSKLLELQSKYTIEMSKEDMAAYLGITIRSLNRSLKKVK